MIRRSPTRIELKLDDLQEYDSMQRAMQARKDQQKANMSTEPWLENMEKKTKQEIINERIGFVPPARNA